MDQIEYLIEGNELVYEDEQDIVRFSAVSGQIQQTITYKKDWFDNKGQPVKAGDVIQITGDEAIVELLNAREYLDYFKVEERPKEFSKEEKKNREPQRTMHTSKDVVKNEEIDSEGIIPIDESKFAQIYGKAKGRIKEVFSKIKSFLNIRSNDRNDKTNDENIK